MLVGDLNTGKWGFIDSSGKTVIEAQVSWVGSFKEGLAQASKADLTPDELKQRGLASFSSATDYESSGAQGGYIDKTGKMVIPPQFSPAKDFSEGLAAVRIGDATTGKWGFIYR